MLKRNLKYIVLVFLSLIVLYFVFSEDNEFEDAIFDTNFVIELLDKNKNLERNIVYLNEENVLFSESIDDYKRQISQNESNLKTVQLDLAICENNSNSLKELSEKQAIERGKNNSDQVISELQCSDNLVKLNFINLQLEELQEAIKQLKVENDGLTSQLSESNIVIDKLNKNADKFASDKAGLIKIIEELKGDLNSSIYVKKIYVTPRYCEGASKKDVVCLEKVLVMANFSKLPVSDVLVSLKDPRGSVIGEVTYNPKNTNIVTFSFSGRTEFLKGEFEISFEVDNILLSKKHAISQK